MNLAENHSNHKNNHGRDTPLTLLPWQVVLYTGWVDILKPVFHFVLPYP